MIPHQCAGQMETSGRRNPESEKQMCTGGLERSNEKPAGTCSTGTDSRSNHGDSAVVGTSEGIGTSCRSEARKNVTKKQARNTHQLDQVNCHLLKQKFMGWCRDQAGLTVDVLAAGYVKNRYDKCLFKIFSDENTSEGQVLIDVDDFIEGGKEHHRKAVEGFYAKNRCGKAIDLVSVGKKGHCLVGEGLCNIEITMSLSQWTSTSKQNFVLSRCQKGICHIPKKSVRGCSQISRESKEVLVGWHQREDRHGSDSLDHSLWLGFVEKALSEGVRSYLIP